LNTLVDFVRELQLGVWVAGARVGADREDLLALLIQDLLAPWRAVVLLHPLYECPYLPFAAGVR
jgi:hypothetical protein